MDKKPVVFEQEYFPEDELIYEELPYTVEVEDGIYIVEGPKIEKCSDIRIWTQKKDLHFFRNF